MTYSEKLKDPRWQKLRLEVFQRDNFTCTSCYSSEKTLHAHHLLYERGKEPWEYELEKLSTLCEDCHKEITEYQKVFEPKALSQLKQKLTDSFIQSCFLTFISDCSQQEFNDIIYILWELKEHGDDILEILRAISRIKDNVSTKTTARWRPDLIKQIAEQNKSEVLPPTTSGFTCKMCGYENADIKKCLVCGWINDNVSNTNNALING